MIALITPTGARPNQFALCKKWMQNQVYHGKVVWIIVDDAVPLSTEIVQEDFRENWTIHKVYPTPAWSGENTQARNIKAGLSFLTDNYKESEIDGVFIIEDDDYYKPVYLEIMTRLFGNFSIIGETNTIYYNVVTRRFVVNPNRTHASLFQTAFRYDAIPYFEKCYYHPFIDCVLWNLIPNRYLFFNNYLSVGMKGMPGRGGIGAGHKSAFTMKADMNMIYLKTIIGEKDASEYAGYYSNSSKPQHLLFTKKSL